MNEQQLLDKLRTTAPTCLRECSLSQGELVKPLDSNPYSVWQLGCTCGCTTGQFLGYSLKDYNEDYKDAECFLSPLAFECNDCNKVAEIFDTDRHGYHADVGLRDGDDSGSGKLRGEGPRKALSCVRCAGTRFEITVAFVFWYLDELAEEFDSRWEDLFNVFLCECKCVSCGEISTPTSFGKL